MKSFGAAVVFLAVINLLTASSVPTTVIDSTSLQLTGSQKLTSPPILSNAPTGSDQTRPATGSSLSTTTKDALTTSTSRNLTFRTLPSPTAELTKVHTSDGLLSSTVADKMSSAKPKVENTSFGVSTTTLRTNEASTKPSGTEPSGEKQKTPAIHGTDSRIQVNKGSSDESKETSHTSNKGIKIGAGCVATVIAIIVLVVIYKICQKKPPAAENAEVKTTAETKENVKLISVKSETPNSDTKRASSNQMESIEC